MDGFGLAAAERFREPDGKEAEAEHQEDASCFRRCGQGRPKPKRKAKGGKGKDGKGGGKQRTGDNDNASGAANETA